MCIANSLRSLNTEMNDSSRCDSQGTVLVIVTSLFLALSTIVFALWLWARRIRRISLAFNDHALLGALVSKNSPYKDSAIQIAGTYCIYTDDLFWLWLFRCFHWRSRAAYWGFDHQYNRKYVQGNWAVSPEDFQAVSIRELTTFRPWFPRNCYGFRQTH